VQDATYTEPEGKDVSLPDDVMRTKALVLHPVSVDEAVGELELVITICSCSAYVLKQHRMMLALLVTSLSLGII
jgi:hypothetical protein